MNNAIIKSEFVKLAKSMREAQKEAPHSQRMQRRARSLEQLFDAQLEKIEEELARVDELNRPIELPLFGVHERPEPIENPASIQTG